MNNTPTNGQASNPYNAQESTQSNGKASTPYILVLYYSAYGQVLDLAKFIAQGIQQNSGIDVKIRTVPDLLPKNAPQFTSASTSENLSNTKTADLAHIKTSDLENLKTDMLADPKTGILYATLDDLEHCAGLAYGSPTRYGNMAAPMKYFLDTTTPLWLRGALENKPACVFTSASSIHGGHESTLLSMMIPLFHHGMIMVGVPYSEPALRSTRTGGSPYGVTHFAGEKGQSISEDEKAICMAQGKRLGKLALQLLHNNS